MEEFKNRLLVFIENHCKMSVRAFEERCGLTNGTVGSVRKKGPGADIVQKISYNFPELNLNWLFRGVGNMLNKEEENTAPSLSIGVNITNWEELVKLIKEKMR